MDSLDSDVSTSGTEVFQILSHPLYLYNFECCYQLFNVYIFTLTLFKISFMYPTVDSYISSLSRRNHFPLELFIVLHFSTFI